VLRLRSGILRHFAKGGTIPGHRRSIDRRDYHGDFDVLFSDAFDELEEWRSGKRTLESAQSVDARPTDLETGKANGSATKNLRSNTSGD